MFTQRCSSVNQAFATLRANVEILTQLLEAVTAGRRGGANLTVGDAGTETYKHEVASLLMIEGMMMLIGLIRNTVYREAGSAVLMVICRYCRVEASGRKDNSIGTANSRRLFCADQITIHHTG
jgi:hypothetical protein